MGLEDNRKQDVLFCCKKHIFVCICTHWGLHSDPSFQRIGSFALGIGLACLGGGGVARLGRMVGGVGGGEQGCQCAILRAVTYLLVVHVDDVRVGTWDVGSTPRPRTSVGVPMAPLAACFSGRRDHTPSSLDPHGDGPCAGLVAYNLDNPAPSEGGPDPG